MLALIPNFKNYSALKRALFKIVVPLVIKKYKPIHNYNVNLPERIRKNLDIPVIAVGGIRTLSDIENIIETRGIDFVSMCRPFIIIETTIVNQFQERKATESKCIDCGYCLLGVGTKKLKCYFGKIER